MNANTHIIAGLQLAEVIDTEDPDSRGRIQVRLNANSLEIWCMVMVAGAGSNYGVSCLPRIGELVVVAFLDREQPVVMGALWMASDEHPENARPVEENYLIRTPAGSELRMNDETPEIEIKTSSGYRVLIDDSAGEIKIEAITSVIDPELCSMCGLCAKVCPYGAITFNALKGVSEINPAVCKGCGSCSAFCPSGAASSRHFRSKQVFAEIDGIFDAINRLTG